MMTDLFTVVHVLGEMYTIRQTEEAKDEKLKGLDGYTDTSIKECVIDSMEDAGPDYKANLEEYKKSVIRHELIHAFLYESGLDSCSWATNEEMIDWLAIQFPKMLKVFKEADAL